MDCEYKLGSGANEEFNFSTPISHSNINLKSSVPELTAENNSEHSLVPEGKNAYISNSTTEIGSSIRKQNAHCEISTSKRVDQAMGNLATVKKNTNESEFASPTTIDPPNSGEPNNLKSTSNQDFVQNESDPDKLNLNSTDDFSDCEEFVTEQEICSDSEEAIDKETHFMEVLEDDLASEVKENSNVGSCSGVFKETNNTEVRERADNINFDLQNDSKSVAGDRALTSESAETVVNNQPMDTIKEQQQCLDSSSEQKIEAKQSPSKDKETMGSSENLKNSISEDFLVLSDIEWSDDEDDILEKEKTSNNGDNVTKDQTNEEYKAVDIGVAEEAKEELTAAENSRVSSDGDDFNLDDVIEEFAKEEESKAVKLSDDELDSLVEEFVETECITPPDKVEKVDPKLVLSDSEGELELLIEDFKAVDSDNDCFIVEDSSNVIVVKDEDNELSEKISKNVSPSKIISDDLKKTLASGNTQNPASQTLDQSEKKKSEIAANNDLLADESVLKETEINDITTKGKNVETPVKDGNLSSKNNFLNLMSKSDEVALGEDSSLDMNVPLVVNTVINNMLESVDIGNSSESSTNKSTCSGKLGDSDENQCLNEMVNKVCKSSDSSNKTLDNPSINVNTECTEGFKKRIEGAKKGENINKMVVDNVQPSEKVHVPSPSSEVRSLHLLCNESLEESKKRKLDDVDDVPKENTKKAKAEENEISAETDTSLSPANKECVLDCNSEAILTKTELKKSWLDCIARRLCRQTLQEQFNKEIIQHKHVIKDNDEKIRSLEEELMCFQNQATTYVSAQQEIFKKYKFSPQVPSRTVAVNVKIFRECDVAPPVLSKVPVTTSSMESHGNNAVATSPATRTPTQQPTVQQLTRPSSSPIKKPSPQALPVQQPAVPKTTSSFRIMSTPIKPRAVVTTSSNPRFVPLSPNVTMTGNAIASVINNSVTRPLGPASTITSRFQATKSNGQVIDLTDEESNKRLLPPATTLVTVPSNTIPKGSLAGLPNNQNVLFPLSSLIQMLPATAQNNQLSHRNPVQVSQHSLVPTLPSNFLGPRTVAYIVPSNSGQINTFGRGTLPVQNFVPGTNQRLQTVFVRVTNPGQVPPLSTVVSSSARMPLLPQSVNTNTAPSSSSSASGLVLFPRSTKHPAPFPAIPEYPHNPKLKSLPPKPSLKGSKAPNGIILSWNMSLSSTHADISNYQLFAYQEGSGPVTPSLWKKVGDVKALPLPMACTLTQFVEGNRYFFTVRAVDFYTRFGPFSDPVSIMYSSENNQTSNK